MKHVIFPIWRVIWLQIWRLIEVYNWVENLKKCQQKCSKCRFLAGIPRLADLRGSDPRSEDGLLKPNFFFQLTADKKKDCILNSTKSLYFFVAFHRLAFSAALKEAEATPWSLVATLIFFGDFVMFHLNGRPSLHEAYTYSQYSADSNNFQEVKCPEVSFFALCREQNIHLKSACEFSKGWSLFEILGLLVNTSNHLIRIEPFSNIGNVLHWIYDGFTWYPYPC